MKYKIVKNLLFPQQNYGAGAEFGIKTAKQAYFPEKLRLKGEKCSFSRLFLNFLFYTSIMRKIFNFFAKFSLIRAGGCDIIQSTFTN
jgi:hypothetical protein